MLFYFVALIGKLAHHHHFLTNVSNLQTLIHRLKIRFNNLNGYKSFILISSENNEFQPIIVHGTRFTHLAQPCAQPPQRVQSHPIMYELNGETQPTDAVKL